MSLLWLIAIYYTAANLLYLLLYVLSFVLVKKHPQKQAGKNRNLPAVSIAISAYNESRLITRCLHSLLQNPYPHLQVILVNDGSTDRTLDILDQEFKLTQWQDHGHYGIYRSKTHPKLLVIDKENTGKADSLNAALAETKTPYLVTLDADTFLEPEAIFQSVLRAQASPHCHAVGGTLRILNGAEIDSSGAVRGHLPKKYLTMFQIVEYIRSFFAGRLGWEYLGGTALLSGAYSLFRTQTLRDVGGFDSQSVTEDFEIIVRIKAHFLRQQLPCEIHLIPSPVCWTIVPENLTALFMQRLRWQQGLVQTLWKHRRLILNPRAGRMGLFTLPYMLLFEALSPLAELGAAAILLSAYFMGVLDLGTTSFYLSLGIGFYVFVTLAAIRLEEMHYARHDNKKPRWRFVAFSILENFGYRQFLFLARFTGNFAALKARHRWTTRGRQELETKKSA